MTARTLPECLLYDCVIVPCYGLSIVVHAKIHAVLVHVLEVVTDYCRCGCCTCARAGSFLYNVKRKEKLAA